MAEQQKPPTNPWQLVNGNWDWPKIRSAFYAGRWPDLEVAAAEIGIRASYLRVRAGQEKWHEQRASIERKAENDAKDRILGMLTREFEKRLIGMLNSADVLRFKAIETLGDKNVKLGNNEAIKALLGATDIEREIFFRRGKPITGGDDEGSGAPPAVPIPEDPGKAGVLSRPTTPSEITDEHLLRIIDAGPSKALPAGPAKPPKPKEPAKAKATPKKEAKAIKAPKAKEAPKPVERQPAQPNPGADPRPSGKGAVPTPRRKG